MKGKKIAKRILALVLALLMVIPAPAWDVQAEEIGTLKDAGTGLVAGSLNTSDTISLPIKIYDYLSDGMLFEYAEGNYTQEDTAFLPNRNVIMDKDDGLTLEDDSLLWTNYGNSVTVEYFDTETDATSIPVSFMRFTKNESPSEFWGGDWNGNQPTFGLRYMLGTGVDLDTVRYVTIVYRTHVTQGNLYMSMYRTVDTDGDGVADAPGSGAASSAGNYTGPMAFTQAGADKSANGFVWTYAVYDLKTGTLAGEYWDSDIIVGGQIYFGLPLTNTTDVIDISRIAFFSSSQLASDFGEYMVTEGGDRGDNRGFGLLRGSRDDCADTLHFEPVTYYAPTVKNINTYASVTQTDEEGNIVYDDEGNEVTVAIDSIDLSTVEGLGYTLLGTFKDNGIANIGLLESSLSEDGYPVYKREVVAYLTALLQHSLELPERNAN